MGKIIPTAGEFAGHEEVQSAYELVRSKTGAIVLLSAVLNLIALSGSIFLLLIYDSVLPSGSVPTLVVLTMLVAFLYILQAIFDTIRQRLMIRLSQALDHRVTQYLQRLEMQALAEGTSAPSGGPVKAFDGIRQYLAGGAPQAFFDLLWLPLFLFVLALMHPYLALTALAGIAVLVAWAWHSERVTERHSSEVLQLAEELGGRRASLRRHASLLVGMGAADRMTDIASRTAGRLGNAQSGLAERAALHTATGRSVRLFVQSAVLAVGAALVLAGQATGGIIFAAAILAGRALAPIDQIVGHWRSSVETKRYLRALRDFLAAMPVPTSTRMEFDSPKADLKLQDLSVAPIIGGDTLVSGLDLRVRPGELLGVIGPSGSGKSTLLRCLAGTIPPQDGTLKLGDVYYNQWDAARRGTFLGYLPQSVDLLPGRIADNICRFDSEAESASIIEAAKLAGVHEAILALPEGYETIVAEGGRNLSGGLCQRIGIARAMFGPSRILLLDEPSSNLDPESMSGLVNAIGKWIAARKSAIVVTHQPAILRDARNLLLLRPDHEPQLGPKEAIFSHLQALKPGGRNVARAG